MYKKVLLTILVSFLTAQLHAQSLKFAKQIIADYVDPDIAPTLYLDVVSHEIIEDAEGNFILAGRYSHTTDFDPSAGRDAHTAVDLVDAFVAKYDTNGNLIWAKTYGGISEDEGWAVVTDQQSNVYIMGNYAYTVDFDPGPGIANRTSTGPSDVYLLKLDKNGSFKWVTTFGGNDYILPTGLGIGNNCDLFLTGNFLGTVDFDPGLGTFLKTSGLNNDIFISKFTTDGNYVWAKTIGGPSDDWVGEIKVSKQGNIFIGGSFRGTGDFDPGVSVQNLINTNSDDDAFIAKYNSDGEYLYAYAIGGPGRDYTRDIAVDTSENIYLTGSFTNTKDFDFLSTQKNLTSNGDYDIFLAKYDSLGHLIWVNSFGASGFDSGTKIYADPTGMIYLAAAYYHTVDFDPSTQVYNLPEIHPLIPNQIFGKYTTDGELVWVYPIKVMNDFEICRSGDLVFTGIFQNQVDVDPSSATLLFTTHSFSYTSSFFGKFSEEAEAATTGNQSILKKICQGEEITLVAAGSPVSWTVGTDPTVISTQPSITVSPSSSIVYHYTSGCQTKSIVVDVLPIPQILGDTELCEGEQTVLSTTGSSPLQWTAGSDPAVISTLSTITVTPTATVTYYLKSGTCPPVNVEVILHDRSSITGDTELCEGEQTQLSTTSLSPLQWTAGSDPAVISTLSTITVTPNTTVTYYLKSGTCPPVNVEVSVYHMLTITGDMELCEGEQTQLSTTAPPPFKWTAGSDPSVISTQSSITVSPDVSTTYYLKNEVCPIADLLVYVYPIPTIDLGQDKLLCTGDSVILDAAGTGARSYLWQNGSTDSFQKVYISGEYKVEVTEGACKNEDAIVLAFNTCESPPIMKIPNLMTPNGDQQNDCFVIENILPDSDLQIFNSWGNLIYNRSNYDNSWNAEGNSSGIYYFHLKHRPSGKEWNGWIHVLK
ncbi:MAG: hypothetical protein K0R51_3004 [Cytophagaceae bacterium]|jgi:gliding motility-associated-like protein|nr:hypothetical protein [Cytophagaceae bacterium]